MAGTFSAERYLQARTRLGMKLGLERMRGLLSRLGHPERVCPALLVAGTNGKGSVTACVDAGLRAAGLRVGRYTSPHLVRLHERITVDGREVSARAFTRAVAAVAAAAERWCREQPGEQHPTFFEAVTAAAFLCFREAGVEVMVLEVGLGGRLDATNVVEPLASAIVSIARDHEEFLGHTLPAIAREKAGVMRAGRLTVLGPLPLPARRTIERLAGDGGARLRQASARVALDEDPAEEGTLRVRVAGLVAGRVRPLPGAHQRANLQVAVALLEAAREAGLAFDLRRAVHGTGQAHWPGRLQAVPGEPPVLLDGAHNPAGARALAAALRGRNFVLVFAAMADKDVEGMARVLFTRARAVVLTRPRMARAASPEELARRAGRHARHLHRAPGTASALVLARRLARPGETVVVAGSLFLVGEALRALEGGAGPLSASGARGNARSPRPGPTPRGPRTSPPAPRRG